jgi:hypothetical protein
MYKPTDNIIRHFLDWNLQGTRKAGGLEANLDKNCSNRKLAGCGHRW